MCDNRFYVIRMKQKTKSLIGIQALLFTAVYFFEEKSAS
ncbi:hypothetical protein B4125_3442 [Bacillus paralicheniformis]|nr:hypothetical protein SC10_B2orf06482 [Bacillus paralicheniformis]OLG05370.1 hypothetical protein B4125_3442 [Bacillus paralicheniformis]TWJ47587.1 hypothetical protein CHCC5027_4012 [Bacillus paralicheniformis]TWJ53816.1 hypothetical protein CHCC5022_0382 [Bacillus paralicheniformis]TWJ83143.1 hypothetical protein CHCC4186_0500 [Bacillus paralicheniformis]